MKKVLLSCVLAIGLLPVAHAQEEEPGRNPTVSYLMEQFGISEKKAQERIDLQLDIADLSQAIEDGDFPGYIDMYIQHEPNFKVEVLFNKDEVDGLFNKNDLIMGLDQAQQKKLRPHVRIRKIKGAREDIVQQMQALSLLFDTTGVRYLGGFNLQSMKFTFTAETNTDIALLQAVVPAELFEDVVLEFGAVPSIQLVSGNLPGDTITGGDTIRTAASSTALRCTLGYAVTYRIGTTTKQGMLTAGHCDDTMFYNVNGHWVTLSNPFVQRDQVGKYDYQIWDLTGLPTSFSITYRNLNGIPEFPSTGTLDLTGIMSFNNQKSGMVVCKSGAVTGITCGQITNGNATFNGASGYIQVSKTLQADISAGGDSGGPWFLYPGSSRDITGVGVHTAGGGTGTSSVAIYMPIDYIDDHVISVNTLKK